ncbi:protein NRT1/ PTR FAMILY 5.5 isoform X2 [Silene latifolia]|uniref:protein NRT1/ PTR FAMILY 5.5 isoform X2 n=1 Tax=Silene latifolia TaxID=37657 RepID=UPI003D7773D8
MLDAFLGNFRLLLLSSVSYTTGLGLIWMSTPPILAKSYGNCSEYKAECIGNLQKQLVYVGLALTAVGMAGQSVSHAPFAAQQANNGGDCSCNILHCHCCCFKCRVNLIGVVALLVVSFVKPWHVLFGISAIIGVVSLLVLLIRVCQYNYVGPHGSSLTPLFRVLFAASSKIFVQTPENADELHENQDLASSALLPHTDDLRFLDKAAIVLENPPLSQQIENKWRLCRVTEVEETKSFIRTIPILMTLIMCGVISSLSATYFVEQANTMNHKSGRRRIPLVLFLWLYAQFRWVFNITFLGIFSLSQFFGVSNRHLPRVGIALAMLFSILCCITAASVESRRLDIVKSHGLMDKPDERVPMNVFSILPQFMLLAGSDGIYYVVAGCFILDQGPMSMMKYFSFFTFGFFGLGFLVSPVLVQVVGLISEKGSGTSWFQGTLNQSRLDKFYWVLAVLAAVNLIVYVVITMFYRYRESRLEQYPELSITVEDSAF